LIQVLLTEGGYALEEHWSISAARHQPHQRTSLVYGTIPAVRRYTHPQWSHGPRRGTLVSRRVARRRDYELLLAPFDTLKVDRSFVAGIETSDEDRAIVLATLGMSRALGLRTVAEGVETEAQLQLLASFDCDEAQGYLLGRPEPSTTIDALLQRAFPAALQLPVNPIESARLLGTIAETTRELANWRSGESVSFGSSPNEWCNGR
jgi:hypothetical protein